MADLKDYSFSVMLGPVWLKLGKGLLMIGVREGEPLPRGVVPKLYKGLRANHLTIPLSTRLHGELAGRYNIHLTYEDGECKERVTVASPHPEQLQGFFARVEEHLDERFLRSLSRVSPAELSTKGYELVLFDKDFAEIVEKFRDTRKGKRKAYRISKAFAEKLAEDAMLLDASVLEHPELERDALPEAPLLVTCLQQTPEQPDLYLKYYPQAPNEGGSVWYAWPREWLPQDFMVPLINQHVGPSVWEFMRTVGTELGLSMDFDKLNRVLEQSAKGS